MKKSILILISIFSILSIVVFAQSGGNTGVSVIILEEPMIFLGDDKHGNDTIDNDGEIWATLTTDFQVKNCEINWGENWQAIDKTITSINHIYFSDGEKTVDYRCYDDNDNFITVNDNILVQIIIACSEDTDCGDNQYIGNPFCQDEDVWQDYITYTCNSPGTLDSYCSDSTASKLKEDCGVDEYSSNYCYDDDVYRDFTDRGCSSGSCFETTTKQLVEDCGEDYCDSWGENYCKDGDVYHKRICYDKGCSNEVCYNNPYIEEQEVEDCEHGCTEGRCLIELCIWTECDYY